MKLIRGDTLRGHLETLVLSVLDSGAAHGFEIWRRLEEAGSGALRLKEGSLYPALYRLEEAGLIRSVWEKSSAERRGARRRLPCTASEWIPAPGSGWARLFCSAPAWTCFFWVFSISRFATRCGALP